MKLKVGDIVLLKATRVYDWRILNECNPVNTTGRVLYISSYTGRIQQIIRVKWSTGQMTEYHEHELSRAKSIVLEARICPH